jgi:signal recognition particle receptor subunit alpha
MLDFFYILTKGGLVLWCVPSTATQFIKIVNDAIDKAVLQGQGSTQKWITPLSPHHIHYKLDNEFELVFIVGYQKSLNISYADKFLDEIQKRFRDQYKDDLTIGGFNRSFPFRLTYEKVLNEVEHADEEAKKTIKFPRSYEESDKKLKTVKIVTKKNDAATDENKKKKPKKMAIPNKSSGTTVQSEEEIQEDEGENLDEQKNIEETQEEPTIDQEENERMPLEEVQQPTMSVAEKLQAIGKKPAPFSKTAANKASPKPEKGKPKKVQAPSNINKMDTNGLDYTKKTDTGKENGRTNITAPIAARPEQGDLKTMAVEASSITSGLVDGFWSKLKKVNVFASKTLTAEDLHTGIETMREHLITKNVASDVAEKICESVSTKLAGKTLGSFESLTSNIRQAMRDTLLMILTPKRRIDILRDVVDAQKAHRPYTITFCGVNGVGKSTNLAKVAYWLSGNDLRVLIAGCDTFRAGAIEQLLTHVRHLNNIFNEKNMPMIELYQRGYGKDAAGIAAEAINYAKDKKFDVVLIDTAGRMQNDEPLMIALAKLIHVNNPDLVLFVGEALVGNEAVDQVTKFNQALIDHARLQANPRVIDGIVLTKFDTIDDKVGAAISMTYTTDKPIVFVGTGQKYQDLKTINADVVTEALLK